MTFTYSTTSIITSTKLVIITACSNASATNSGIPDIALPFHAPMPACVEYYPFATRGINIVLPEFRYASSREIDLITLIHR